MGREDKLISDQKGRAVRQKREKGVGKGARYARINRPSGGRDEQRDRHLSVDGPDRSAVRRAATALKNS